MITIRFHVDGLPPKKDGANSMWGKPLEAERLVSLRKAALEAMGGRPSLKSNISLAVSVHVGAKNDRSVGDLDTFITGVCDGLMAMARGCKLCPDIWERSENRDIYPERAVAMVDDCQVVSIQADKIIGGASLPWYEVALTGD